MIVVDNDFHQTMDIFKLFQGLAVKNMDERASAETITNGHQSDAPPHVNGEYKAIANGISNGLAN
jgi:hypothetical protein